MFANMSASLNYSYEPDRYKLLQRRPELRPVVEKLITPPPRFSLSSGGDLHARSSAIAQIRDLGAVGNWFDTLG